MQIKPSTAAGPPISIRNVHHVENNIHAGAKYIRFIIDQYYGDEAMSELDKMLFAFASYTIHFAVADGGQGSKGAVPGGTPPTRYDASGKVRCSADKPTLDQWCDFRVVRDLPRKAADIWIANIAFKSEER